jgi:hypothetical protein
MKKVKMKWLAPEPGKHISQIYSQGLEFAFATKTEQCTDFVYCKDFLHDCVWSILHKKSISPYGFKYDPKNKPIGLKRSYILVANSADTKIGEKVAGCQDFLNQAEKKLGLFRTKISECENPPSNYSECGIFLFRGSGMWLNSPPLVSLYSLFIRLGFCHKVGDNFMDTINKIQDGTIKPYQSNDKDYVTRSRAGIDAILNLGYRKFFYKDTEKNYPDAVDISTLHNYFGIVGFTQLFTYDSVKTTPPQKVYKPHHADKVPKYWHRRSVKKLFEEAIKEK